MAKKKPKTMGKKAMAKAIEFVEEYLKNGRNGRQAYLKVYTGTTNEGTAAVEACKLLKNPNVSAYLQERDEELRAKYRLTTDDVMRSLSQAMHFDPSKLYNEDGSLKPVHQLDEDTRMALSGLEVSEIGAGGDKPIIITKKVKWTEKNTAREQAMKHFGMFAKDKDPPAAPTPVNVTVKLSPQEAYLRALNGPGKTKAKR